MTKTKEKGIGKVKMVDTNNKPTRTYNQYIEGFGRLGRELKISPKTNVVLNREGFKTEFFVPTININIGIGNHHSIDIIMTVSAWKEFQKGTEIITTTDKEFKEKYL